MSLYYYGKPENDGTWEAVANIFADHDSVNSERTSSLPLVQFWQPCKNGLSKCAKELLRAIGIVEGDFADLKYCFEFPVPVKAGRGKASMTDLMILTEQYVIAIEAKWTEYRKGYQRIKEWLKKGNQENKNMVLQGWISYINQFLKLNHCEPIPNDNKKSIYDEIPYQLLHRMASACAIAVKSPQKRPIVLYQLFCDSVKLTKRLETFSRELKQAYRVLFSGKSPFTFLIARISTEIIEADDMKEKENQNKIFNLMCNREVYKFNLPEIIWNSNETRI